MANVSAPHGFRPVQYMNGAAWNGQLRPYRIASATATGIFTGDPVTFNSTGYITQCAAGGIQCGIFMGCKFTDATGTPKILPYWPAAQATLNSVDAVGLIMDDPNVLGEMEMDSAMTVAALGANFNTNTMAAGSTATGQSVASLAFSTLNTTALQFRVIDWVPRADNDRLAAACKVLVLPNLSFYRSTTGI